MFQKHENFFTEAECNLLLAEVEEHKQQWKVNPLTQFRTLGNCLFSSMVRMGSSNTHNYQNENQDELKVYELFKDKLKDLFNDVGFTQNFGKPGYTVILPNQPSSYLWHYDNELPLFPYSKEFTDYTNDFHSYFDKSYTFVVMISKGDYSFDYYPETVSKYQNTFEGEMSNSYCKDHVKLIGDVCPNVNCNLTQYEKINYKQGTLLIQEERFLHRASPATFSSDNEMRVIVRGYGVVKNNKLYIFW